MLFLCSRPFGHLVVERAILSVFRMSWVGRLGLLSSLMLGQWRRFRIDSHRTSVHSILSFVSSVIVPLRTSVLDSDGRVHGRGGWARSRRCDIDRLHEIGTFRCEFALGGSPIGSSFMWHSGILAGLGHIHQRSRESTQVESETRKWEDHHRTLAKELFESCSETVKVWILI